MQHVDILLYSQCNMKLEKQNRNTHSHGWGVQEHEDLF